MNFEEEVKARGQTRHRALAARLGVSRVCDVIGVRCLVGGDPKAAGAYWCATIERVSAPLSTGLDPLIAARLKRDAAGLVPAVVQQYDTGEVLMLAWMNDAALARTLATLEATYWSRSRQSLWVKGQTSGHRQAVKSVALDCDGDTLLVRVDQTGPACHTGAPNCFGDVLPAAHPMPTTGQGGDVVAAHGRDDEPNRGAR